MIIVIFNEHVKWKHEHVQPMACHLYKSVINTLRPGKNDRYFADDIFKCIFLNEKVWISLKISLKFVPMVRISNISALVQIMAWRRPGDKPLSESMMISLPTHICVTRPQWVKNSIKRITERTQWNRNTEHKIQATLLIANFLLHKIHHFHKQEMKWPVLNGFFYRSQFSNKQGGILPAIMNDRFGSAPDKRLHSLGYS